MKKAIPKEWVDIIKKENSKKSVVNHKIQESV
jgi:hypothetical protein